VSWIAWSREAAFSRHRSKDRSASHALGNFYYLHGFVSLGNNNLGSMKSDAGRDDIGSHR